MADDRQAILKVGSICLDKHIDRTTAYSLIQEHKNDLVLSTTNFGKRFIARLKDVSFDDDREYTCIICGKNKAVNNIACSNCNDKVQAALGKSSNGMSATSNAASGNLIDEIVKNVDSSMDRLASQKTVNKSMQLSFITFIMTIVNTVGIIGIALYMILCLGK